MHSTHCPLLRLMSPKRTAHLIAHKYLQCAVPFRFHFFFSFSFAFGFPLALKRRLATVQLLFLSVLLLAHSFLIVGNGIMLGFLVLPHATSAIARLSPGPGLVFMCDWLCEQTACRTAHIPKVKVKCCCGCC